MLTIADTLEDEHCWVVGVGDAGAALVCSIILHCNPPQAQYNCHPDTRVLLDDKKYFHHWWGHQSDQKTDDQKTEAPMTVTQ